MLMAGLWPKVIMFHRWPKRPKRLMTKELCSLAGASESNLKVFDLAQEKTDLYCNWCLHKLNHCKKRFYLFCHYHATLGSVMIQYESELS